MKISELENAPAWLLDATTDRADVCIDSDGRIIWWGGIWYGGNWQGGDWYGGDWRGGNWYGGNWWGGNWWGGNWRGGIWRGGIWWGGNWYGGNWWGGNWWGEFLFQPPTVICKFIWPITISPSRMKIGCKLYSHKEWAAFTDSEIDQMEVRALKWWGKHKEFLLTACALKAKEANHE